MFEELSEKHGEEFVERAIEAVKAEENKDKEDFSESDWNWVGKLASKLEETDSKDYGESTDEDQANEEELDAPGEEVPEEGQDETDMDQMDLTDDDDTDGGDDEEMSQQNLTSDGEELESVEEAVESFMEDEDVDLDDALEMIEV
jgi:hypothetical protein